MLGCELAALAAVSRQSDVLNKLHGDRPCPGAKFHAARCWPQWRPRLFVRGASAEAAWPNRPVQVMVPYPPAGGADTTARILYAKLGTILGQQFVIENRGGAGGTIGEAVVANAGPRRLHHPA